MKHEPINYRGYTIEISENEHTAIKIYVFTGTIYRPQGHKLIATFNAQDKHTLITIAKRYINAIEHQYHQRVTRFLE